MKIRLSIFFLSLLFVFVLIIFRLFYWQIMSADTLRGLLEQQTLSKVVLIPNRGRIFSRDESPLVLNQRAFQVYAEPQRIENSDQFALVLSKELDIPVSSISSKLNPSLQWVSIAQKIDEDKKSSIQKYNLQGIGFLEESKRYYPESSMAAQLLGFVGKDAKGDDVGYFGIEGFYDNQLRGRSGIMQREQDSKGIPILFGNAQELNVADGRDLYLTLDKTIQYISEQQLRKGVEKYGAKGGSIIIMDPQSGAILAMASYPSYDQKNIEKYPMDVFKNPAVASSYEPGSTFKVLVMAAALNEKKVQLDSMYSETGPIEIGKYAIKTWNQKYHGDITLAQILEYSSNVGMVDIQRKLGNELLMQYISNLGFGELTHVDLQEESTPLLRNKEDWKDIDFATASFGQGIAVTPLQMIRAVGAIANEGKMMRPYIVQKILTENGKTVFTHPQVDRIVYSSQVAQLLSEMMASAVQNGETKNLKPANLRIAGKTGTAQIPIAGHYDSEKTIASFVGFAPVTHPKFIMLVTIQEPTTSPWGSETAAPVFFAIAKELYTYLGISSSE